MITPQFNNRYSTKRSCKSNQGRYYSFTITDKHENLLVSLTPNDDGDPFAISAWKQSVAHGGRKRGHYDLVLQLARTRNY